MDTNNFNEKKAPRLYQYVLPGNYLVLVGKSDVDNDQLTLKLARPQDWWFHVRGLPGSHVVLKVDSNQEPDRRTLKKAAAIAAWHSKVRGGGVVAVSGTLARFVTKPKGVKTGTVQIRKEQIFKVRPAIPSDPI